MELGLQSLRRAQRFIVDTLLHMVGMVDHRLYMRLFNRVMTRRGMSISGTPRYVSPRAIIDGGDPSLIHLGDGVVISSGVRILTHDFSIDRFIRESDSDGDEAVLIAPVHIGDRCFVGAGSILLPGTELGDDVLVGAGSVVRGKIAAGVVLVGNPAQVATTSEKFLDKNRTRIQGNTGRDC